MTFMEGSYRLSGEFWKVVIFMRDDISEVQYKTKTWHGATKWEGEIDGLVIRFPRAARMGRAELIQAISQAVGYSEWVQVQGPDSMILR